MNRRLAEALARRSRGLAKRRQRPVLAYFWDLVKKAVRPTYPRLEGPPPEP